MLAGFSQNCISMMQGQLICNLLSNKENSGALTFLLAADVRRGTDRIRFKAQSGLSMDVEFS